MNITGTYFEKIAGNANVQTQAATQDNNFGKVLDEAANKKEVSKTDNKANNTKQTSNKQKNTAQTDKKANVSDKDSAVNADNKVAENENVSKTEAPKNTEATKPVSENGDSEKLAEAIVEEVAESLGITNEALMQILAQLNIQPAELTDAKNINLVIQKVMGAETPIELLTMEGVTDLFKQVEEAVDTAVEKVNNEAGVTAKPEVSKETVTAAANNVQAEVSDELELTDESLRSSETATKAEVKVTSQSEAQSGNFGNQNADSGAELFGEAEITVNMATQSGEGSVNISTIATKAESLRSVNPQEVTSQIIEKVKVDIKPGVSEIRLNLKPESLGEVSLRIASENGVITAHFVAENQKVKEIIESSFNQLQDALSEQGLNVMELSVSVSSGNNEQQMQEFMQGRAKSQARISSIISAIDENGEIIQPEIDETEIYDNNVNYKV